MWIPLFGWTLAAAGSSIWAVDKLTIWVVDRLIVACFKALSAAVVGNQCIYVHTYYNACIVHTSIHVQICTYMYIYIHLHVLISELFMIAFAKQSFICSVLFLNAPPLTSLPSFYGFGPDEKGRPIPTFAYKMIFIA